MTYIPPFLGLLLVLGIASASHAHGTERHFGTPINGGRRGSTGRIAPAFALMALGANLRGIERAVEEGRIADTRERARRLPSLARELIAGAGELGSLASQEASAAVGAISEGVTRIESAAARGESDAVLREVTRVNERVAFLEDLLRREGDSADGVAPRDGP